MQKGIQTELMQNVLETFHLTIPVTQEVLTELASNFTIETFRSGDIIEKPNTKKSRWYFIEKGLVRTYFYREDAQVTVMFFSEGSCLSVFEKYYYNEPSKFYIEAIEPTQIYALDKKDGDRLRSKYLSVAELHRKMLTQYLMSAQEHLDLLKYESAEARYEKLMERIPDILLRIPSIYVASYLGLTPETVSRVRSRLAKRGPKEPGSNSIEKTNW
ncbi:MAG: Crp/Fnr family transcriptional regulator [Paludibacteraceae bacterium]|nr:Crp/Fnr family transcriptional regulator [Paludibacteraceae bacterium]